MGILHNPQTGYDISVLGWREKLHWIFLYLEGQQAVVQLYPNTL